MSVLDALREGLLRGLHPSDAETFGDYVDDTFRDFDAEHPGLVDNTITCPRCGRKGWQSECVGPTFDEQWDGVAVEEYDAEGTLISYDHICPACANAAG